MKAFELIAKLEDGWVLEKVIDRDFGNVLYIFMEDFRGKKYGEVKGFGSYNRSFGDELASVVLEPELWEVHTTVENRPWSLNSRYVIVNEILKDLENGNTAS